MRFTVGRWFAPLLLALTLACPGSLPAQLQVYPCRQRIDSLVVNRPDVEVRILFHGFDSPTGWSGPLTTLLQENAQSRLAGALSVAAETDPVVAGSAGPVFVEEGRMFLVWGSPELVVLRDTYYTYSAGAAHGDENTHFRILAWHKGKLKPVTLADLLKWNRELRNELNRQIEGQLRLLGASAVLEGRWEALDARRLQDAAPTALGLLYVLNLYEAGSRAEGAFEILIPWRALAAWIPAGESLDRMLQE
ncbi:MAG: RsiV family protein [Candidatus Delongbacteria bacterium]